MCKILLKVNLKSQIKPEVQVHSKPSECTKPAFTMMELLSITDNDFNLLYLELAGQPNKMIMYPGFKNYIEKHM